MSGTASSCFCLCHACDSVRRLTKSMAHASCLELDDLDGLVLAHGGGTGIRAPTFLPKKRGCLKRVFRQHCIRPDT
jgi:hypothetical protein